MADSLTWSTTTHDATATRALGARLGGLLRAGDLVRLEGELGAGKTTLVQGIAAGLGSRSRATSPTFTLVNEYPGAGGLTIYHVDAYRLDAAEAGPAGDTLGLADLLDSLDDAAAGGVLLIEWSARLAPLLPAAALAVRIAYGAAEDERLLHFAAAGPRAAALLAALAHPAVA